MTKNGCGDRVVISYEEYENIQYEMLVSTKLHEAEIEAETTEVRYPHREVMEGIRAKLAQASEKKNVWGGVSSDSTA